MGRTTISITDETKKRFIQARGSMEVVNGNPRNEDEVLNQLIDFFECFPSLADLENLLDIITAVNAEYPYVLRYTSAQSIVERLLSVRRR